MMKGEFDDHLKWPLNAVINVRIDKESSFPLLLNVKVENTKRVSDPTIIEQSKSFKIADIPNCDCLNFTVVRNNNSS